MTVLDFVCWPETMVDGRNELARADAQDILCKLAVQQKVEKNYQPFGDGKAAYKIVNAMETWKKERE